MTDGAAATPRVRVWDLPTRLSHWTIVILFVVCWLTAETDHMRWHRIAGYGVLWAVWFRLAWGFWGAETAQFRNFVRGPAAIVSYARGLLRPSNMKMPITVGHNPLGALSIVVMLGLLLTQTTFGLFAVDVDGIASGPLSRWVSFETARRFAHWHSINFNLLLIMIAVHLSAIAVYRFARHESLVPAMIHGFKVGVPADKAPYFVSRWRAALFATLIFALLVALVNFR